LSAVCVDWQCCSDEAYWRPYCVFTLPWMLMMMLLLVVVVVVVVMDSWPGDVHVF